MSEGLVTRLAPSPTGALHLGNARTLALTWWWARAVGGRVVLRIEDLDSPRKKLDAVPALRADLAWLGLEWDDETPAQSTRRARHQHAFERLVAAGAVFPCTCTRRDVDEAHDAPHEGGEARYPGTCRARGTDFAAVAATCDRPVAVRMRVPAGVTRVDDLVLGPADIDLATDGGDFVIGRFSAATGFEPGYQLAVVVDDADDGVTHVIRGADLLVSAARQRLLQRALGLSHVAYGHLPLVVGPDGRRLAKRHGDTRLATLRARGVASDAVWQWIAASVGRAFTSRAARLAAGFDPAWVPRTPVHPPAGW